MSIKALDRLETIHRLNANQSWVNKDLYRLLSRPEFLILAYEQIKSKPGNMTSGEDGETLDGMSYAEIIRISESLKDESFFFKPTRRVEIPKKDGKKRPLGVPSPKDKIVQKAMLMILEAIYDSKVNPTFVDESHGFRGERSCHTALKQIRNWSGITWAIEGDIKGFFDNICHETLIKLIRKRIDDERFINLIWKALRSGFTFEGVLHATKIGTPQGSIISPILANIYLHEYDLKVKQWVAEFEKGKKRRPNPEWRSVHRKAEYRIKKMGYADDQAKSLLKQARSIPTVLVNDPEFIRVKYVRYADDWIIGITGPKALATLIKEKASEFLSRELRLELSQDKTKITHLSTQAARFLGTMIDSKSDLDYLSTVEKEGKSYRRRGITNRIRLRAPTRELLETLREKGFAKSRNKEFIPIHKGAWINLDPDQIVMGYNAVKRGIFNYYSFVDNRQSLSWVNYILQMSLARTLAAKYRTSARKEFAKRGRYLTVKVEKQGVVHRYSFWNPTGQYKPRPTAFAQAQKMDLDRVIAIHSAKMTKTKLGHRCCVCGDTDRIQMHHVKHVRKGTKDIKCGVTKMISAINRKQIPVCHTCHWDINITASHSRHLLTTLNSCSLSEQGWRALCYESST